jgi:hypothetical protein
MAARLLAAVVLLLAVGLHAPPSSAQDPSSTTTTLGDVPDQDIIPSPNAGEEPGEVGDRGGALQLAVLALVVVAIGGAVALVVRQARRTQAGSG